MKRPKTLSSEAAHSPEVQQKREDLEQAKEWELAAAQALEAGERHRRELSDLQRQQDQVRARMGAIPCGIGSERKTSRRVTKLVR